MFAHKNRQHHLNRQILSLLIFAAGIACSSCATVVHGWNHRFTSPAYIGIPLGKVFVEGKPHDVKMVVSGADSKTKENNYFTYKTTTTTTTLYFDKAVLIFPKQKYVTVEIRGDDDKSVLESYLLRRDPRYVWYGLDTYLTLGIGSIVDMGDNLAYDWELVAYKKH